VNATGLDLSGCPGVSRAEARATREASRVLAALPPAWQADVPPLGAVTVAAVGVGQVPDDVIGLGARRDLDRARLSIAAALAARWVDRAIGTRDLFAPVRALGPAERGVLIALLGPVLEPIGWSLALGPAPPADGAAVVLRVAGAAGAGTMWWQAPPPSRNGRGALGARAAGLPIAGRLRIAATSLEAGALAGLAAGDTVVFDGTPASGVGRDVAWQAELVAGGYSAGARLDPDGAVTIARAWRAAPSSIHQPAAAPARKDPNMDAENPTEIAAAALAGAPVEVVAELGRITLRGEEILGLAPGVVLGLRVDRTSAVSLRIGGEVWAEGELVNVEGELGVRITRLLPR
jgi:type III secretion system YscQ/HrcQ family protein